MFPYYFIRFSGPLLFVLVGLKILSGYSLTGKFTGVPWLPGFHENRTLDFLLILLFIFHAFYGLRLFLIDIGMMRRERLLFWTSTFLGVGLFALGYVFFF
jgi:hypothetical protein